MSTEGKMNKKRIMQNYSMFSLDSVFEIWHNNNTL